jgi:adenosine kinase
MTGWTEKDILDCNPQIFITVTNGDKGAIIYSQQNPIEIPAVSPVQIADPTGVGDAFRGGFLTGYGLGLDLQTCGQMGALAATCCLEQHGPQGHHYTPSEFVVRYRSIFDDRGALDILLKRS